MFIMHIIIKNFNIFYTIIKNKWSNISSQWNSDKLFNIVSHYAAAKQNFITVNLLKSIMKILENFLTLLLIY